MRRRRHSRKLNNVGMSLVEVVVAMAILSIVILPVLHTFVQSARYNATARMRQQTTAAAQTVMENFKAYSVEEIQQQFINLGFSTTCTENYLATGDYLFEIRDMQYQNEYYDVRVELTSHKDVSDSSGTDEAKVGSMDSLIYTSRTAQNDAVYSGHAEMDALALQGILEDVADKWNEKENAASPTPDPSASPEPISAPASHTAGEVDESTITITERIMTFTVSKPADVYVVQANCQYIYRVDNHPYTDPDTGAASDFNIDSTMYIMDLSGDPDDGKDYAEFFNLDTELKSLTLYYYPAYSYVPPTGDVMNAPIKIGKDTININNTCSELGELKCYIYKQKNLALSDIKISTAELANYNVYINLTNAGIYDDNLNMVLGDTTGSTIDDAWIHVSAGANRYKGIGYEAVKGLSDADKEAMSGITIESQRLMYDVSITVYNRGEMSTPGAQPLNQLTGTIVK